MQCSQTKKLLTALAIKSPMGDYTLQDGIIRYKGRVYVSQDTELQLNLLKALHSFWIPCDISQSEETIFMAKDEKHGERVRSIMSSLSTSKI